MKGGQRGQRIKIGLGGIGERIAVRVAFAR